MTITTTRSTFLAAMAIAASVSLVVPAVAHMPRIPARQTKDESKKMTKTESGLQYHDMEEGTGETPKTGQTCVVHYTGWLWENNAKGKKFDSSRIEAHRSHSTWARAR